MKELLKSTIAKVFLTMLGAVLLISLTEEANDSYGIIEGGKGIILFAISAMGFVYAYFIAEQDAGRTIKGTHWAQWILRAIYISFLPAILLIQSGNFYNVLIAFCGASSFYLVFDPFYNKRKDYALTYVGTQSFLDKLVRKYKLEKYYWAIRLGIFLVLHAVTIMVL